MIPPLWQKVKRTKKPLDENEEESEKAGLKFSVQKAKLWHPVPSLHGNWMGKQWKQGETLFSWAPKSLQIVTAAMKLKEACSLEEKL